MSAIVGRIMSAAYEADEISRQIGIDINAPFITLSTNDVYCLAKYIREIESKAKLGDKIKHIVMQSGASR